MSHGRFMGFVILVVLVGVLAGCYEESGPSASSRSATRTEAPDISVKVTKAEYLRIEDGMSYSEVVGIINEYGEELSRSKMPGVPGVYGEIVTVMYQWQNRDGSNMNAMFQNDSLMCKAQYGLR